MSKIRITKEFRFEMAHALLGYDGMCSNIHGHSYQLSVTLIGETLNNTSDPKNGMVMDFGDMKEYRKERDYWKIWSCTCAECLHARQRRNNCTSIVWKNSFPAISAYVWKHALRFYSKNFTTSPHWHSITQPSP